TSKRLNCTLTLVIHSALSDQRNITAGQNITLPCQAPNNNIIVIEWSRADVKEEYVLMYRDRHFDSINQHPSFKNRVDLQDKQMKDGDVSLILKNVTVNDTGTYECRVFMKGTNRRKRANLNTDPINKIKLNVTLNVKNVIRSVLSVTCFQFRLSFSCNLSLCVL
uniref:Ig-like domain-containing protein n=1 Tax=Maylandia zebra TaxID=106582 RepID=A0A3P9BYW2_9CICH